MNLTLYFVKILLYNDMYIFHIYIKGERIMKKTRFIAIMTIIALCLSSFVGCGKAGEEAAESLRKSKRSCLENRVG